MTGWKKDEEVISSELLQKIMTSLDIIIYLMIYYSIFINKQCSY